MARASMKKPAFMKIALTLALGAGAITGPGVLGGCASTGIALREQLGYAKREQLVNRVKDARDGQEAAKQQFQSALQEFLAVTSVNAQTPVKELEERYDALRTAYDRSKSRADAVRGRVRDVERVADALFREWENELEQYSEPGMRAASERQLTDTRGRYQRLHGALKDAESRMDPVLKRFNDQVLFLKHNLNARAIAGLEGTVSQVQSDVAGLIAEMEQSIAEANAFIEEMGPQG